MSTAEVTEENAPTPIEGDAPTTEPTTETTTTEPAPEAPTPEATPEPAPAPKEKSDVGRCSFQANGTYDKGTVDVKATSCDVDFDTTQILIIVHEGKQYHFNRTAIKEIA